MTAAKRVHVSGVVLLVVGLLAAVIVFCTARREERLGILGLDVQTNRQTLELERMGGKSYLLFNDLNQWFASLWRGRRLAYTVGILSFAGFLGCRWFADLLAHAPATGVEENDKNS
jgi:hypothetical protein